MSQDNDGKVLGTQISAVTKKQLFALKTWEREHPNWKNSESQTKTYMELVQKTLGCSTDKEHRRSVLKICKNILHLIPNKRMRPVVGFNNILLVTRHKPPIGIVHELRQIHDLPIMNVT